MSRPDLSDDLIHWMKGDTYDEAFDVLVKIVTGEYLLGGTGMIKGGYRCVCFTESPINSFHKIQGKYKPFGLAFTKSFMYSQGARPVIYQSESEYGDLPESLQWRHVRFDLVGPPVVDFTWEREWRLLTDSVKLCPEHVRIILPGDFWLEELVNRFDFEEIQICHYVNSMYGEMTTVPQEFPYQVLVNPFDNTD
ncbi:MULTISPECIES: hypothetical protein [Alcaligenes]|uniref:hypothetical protein n=1 Tax=Alcaligenes TaxID=507 RepID=UPI0009F551FB|nr:MULTISPECIES: hypothetical protein [Alcaligenes]OQV33600.1 hypothetical protein BV899_05960 [Alcaligenes phenolicus]ULH08194.1 hypothetical protein MF263_07005 [Alcaligenes faecalis]